jgi:hypothetical protein
MASRAEYLTLTNPGSLDERSRVPKNLIVEAKNLGLAHEGWLVMRPGAGHEELTGSGLTGPIQWLGRHVTSAGSVELWGAADNSGTAAIARRLLGVWYPGTFSDPPLVAHLRHMHGTTLNGKFFIAYDSDVNRLHVWDGTTLRRVGFVSAATPEVSGAPTVDAISGTGITDEHWYRVRWVELTGAVVTRRSEPTASVSLAITDDAGWRITRPTVLPNEGETHWELEASEAATGPWYRIARIAIATTTYDHTVDAIDITNLSAPVGDYYPPPSAKYLVSDGSRLLMANAWETAAAIGQTEPKPNRVWYTPVLGTTDEGDDERIPNSLVQQNWIDVGDGAEITGLAGPLYGDVYVFKTDSIYKLTPTGDSTTPYRSALVSTGHGAVSQRCITHGIGPQGEPAIYFANETAVYRITAAGGIQELSQAIARDLRGAAFTTEQSFLAFDSAQQQLFVNVTTGTAAYAGAYTQFTMDARSGRWTGIELAGTAAGWIIGISTLGDDTVLGESAAYLRAAAIGEASDGLSRLFLGGQDVNGDAGLMSWGSVLTADNGEPFTAVVRWRGLIADGKHVRIGHPIVVYRNAIGASPFDDRSYSSAFDLGRAAGTLTIALSSDDGKTRSQAKTLASSDPNDPLAMQSVVYEGLELADTYILDVTASLRYTQGSTGDVWPGIDCLQIPYWVQEAKAS